MKDRQKVIKYIASVEKQLYALFGSTYEAALHLTEVRKAIEAGDTFTWQGNPTAEKKLDRYLKDLSNKASVIIKNGIIGSWNKGETNAKVPVVEAFGKTPELRKEANDICDEAVKAHRAKGKTGHAFANASRGGMNISTRVWNLTGNAKQELETIIQNGILEGKSPDEVSRSVKGYLNEPNALFRRVRNKETGNLELSEAAKKYHPGQGVYRSAYKNARRLAVTEMNAAFRRAEWESYQNNPLITGYEIRLSNNHTTLIKGKRVPLTDICDRLAGVYPKTFLWTGWHPHCRCEMIPILISENDFRSRIKARKAGKLDSWKPQDKESQPIAETPKQLTKWQNENKARLLTAKSTPRFLEDNKGLISLSQQQKALSLFSGSLQQFADQLFKTGRSLGQVKQIGRIDDAVRNDMQVKGRALETETIVVMDKTVLKYIGHPKATKGATVAPERYSEIESTINAPTHIYEDLNSKELVYVYTHPYDAGKVIKVVVHPNYKYKGVVTNVAKSWGIVDSADMNANDYRLIK